MDMSTISAKMLQKRYESIEDMVADFVQMFDNACKYNEPDSLIYKVWCVDLNKRKKMILTLSLGIKMFYAVSWISIFLIKKGYN